MLKPIGSASAKAQNQTGPVRAEGESAFLSLRSHAVERFPSQGEGRIEQWLEFCARYALQRFWPWPYLSLLH
ncbi:hypothetical protein [Neokomagataea tanensis]|uniref:hypothetical protein n=1 Tax=Neokomagataea tanensis TaxID=661191 RepID=UPI001477418C|nr:hypothetical protein [Neokomagataea tanensis]